MNQLRFRKGDMVKYKRGVGGSREGQIGTFLRYVPDLPDSIERLDIEFPDGTKDLGIHWGKIELA